MQCVLSVCTCLLLAIVFFTSAVDRLYRPSVPVLLGCVFFTVKKAPTAETDFDLLTKMFNFVPGLLLKFVVWLLRPVLLFGGKRG